MASDILHIKDSYYFEVPKFLWPSTRRDKAEFPDVWVKLDADFQHWEAERLYEELSKLEVSQLPAKGELLESYEHWKHQGHANFAKPFDLFLEQAPSQAWFQKQLTDDAQLRSSWTTAKNMAGGPTAVRAYKADTSLHDWSKQTVDGVPKLEAYNQRLSGKILIPQVMGGELRNLYEAESGICVSKFMVIQLVVALVMVMAFTWLAGKVRGGTAPKGRLWNMLEAILLFLRDEVARPAIGHGADKFVPLLWTIFLFILGCNLMGMLPWVGAPTGAFAVTLSLAFVILGTGVIAGSKKFGVAGFWLNQVPSMDLPIVLAVVIKPMIFLIELLGMFIKHGVLGVRLLANMVAGHLVLLAIMGLAFSLEGALNPNWYLTAVIAVIGSTLFSCLELFVAFLQAYVFTFLSALFIGAATHHH